MNRTTDFFISAVAIIIFTIGTFALIGWSQFEQDRDNHSNMQEKK